MASSMVWQMSQTRSSTVGKVRDGRMSHHSSPLSWMKSRRRYSATRPSNSAQEPRGPGRPVRGMLPKMVSL